MHQLNNMSCSMFSNHNAYTSYKGYESFNATSVNVSPMGIDNSLTSTIPGFPSQNASQPNSLHQPQCRYTYGLPNQALNTPGSSLLTSHTFYDPELEARAKQLQELER